MARHPRVTRSGPCRPRRAIPQSMTPPRNVEVDPPIPNGAESPGAPPARCWHRHDVMVSWGVKGTAGRTPADRPRPVGRNPYRVPPSRGRPEPVGETAWKAHPRPRRTAGTIAIGTMRSWGGVPTGAASWKRSNSRARSISSPGTFTTTSRPIESSQGEGDASPIFRATTSVRVRGRSCDRPRLCVWPWHAVGNKVLLCRRTGIRRRGGVGEQPLSALGHQALGMGQLPGVDRRLACRGGPSRLRWPDLQETTRGRAPHPAGRSDDRPR